MIIYSNTKSGYMDDCKKGQLVSKLQALIGQKLGRSGQSEVRSWQNSLQYMYMVMDDDKIPNDSGVAIEYVLPTSRKRIDFLLTGFDQTSKKQAVIIELKQWTEVSEVVGQNEVVSTLLGGGIREVPHPSYQALSYAEYLKDYNESVRKIDLGLHPCSFLHNYHEQDHDQLFNPKFSALLKKSPSFTARHIQELQTFITKYIQKGDNRAILVEIENGKIKPSKSLQDSLSAMLKGNREFIMLDEQKVVFEQALDLAKRCQSDGKRRTLIIKGGPGTGKSVVAVNLLVEYIKCGLMAQYITKNVAPRQVYEKKLRGDRFKKKDVDALFTSSGTFVHAPEKVLDVAIVDEAHRLTQKTGLFKQGEDQILEIMRASTFSIFFADDHQRIHIKDYGSVARIKSKAYHLGSEIFENELVSQFRCNGSDGYLAWLDNVLEIRPTANYFFDLDYDIDVVDNPHDLYSWVLEKNQNNKARMLAGYCWDWNKNTSAEEIVPDINIPEYDFHMSWNFAEDNRAWAIAKGSVDEIGCIHTSQGLEFEYVGVIIGEDMRYEHGHIVTDFTKRSSGDASIRGLKNMYKENPAQTLALADEIIKNTYRTLLTRGMKGCRIFCMDKALANYLRLQIRINVNAPYSLEKPVESILDAADSRKVEESYCEQ